MGSKKEILFVLLGLGLLSLPLGALAAHPAVPSLGITTSLKAKASSLPTGFIYLAQQDEWHHHHDHTWQPQPIPASDYNWGGPHRYKYAPQWFNSPPPSWSNNSRRAYLKERRQVAINMQQQMLARGDTNAAQRLGTVIGQLDHELGYR